MYSDILNILKLVANQRSLSIHVRTNNLLWDYSADSEKLLNKLVYYVTIIFATNEQVDTWDKNDLEQKNQQRLPNIPRNRTQDKRLQNRNNDLKLE